MDNIPSIYKIEYLSSDNLNNFSYLPGDTVDVYEYISSGSFTELFFHGNASLSSQSSRNDAGVLFEIKSSGQIASKDVDDLNTLNTLANANYVYRLTDVNGKQYLIGTNNNPAKITYREMNDSEPAGFRGYGFDISWQSTIGIIYLA